MSGMEPITAFEQWYDKYEINPRDGSLDFKNIGDKGAWLWRQFDRYKREMTQRVGNYEKLEMMADAQVVSPKPDLPNISSGEAAGIVRRIARNLVQNTPNVDVISQFDDDSAEGIFSRHILTAKIIGSDEYSNDMQQCLFASTKTALTLGFDCVVPVLMQESSGSWRMKYDTIHYRDVFPEPGAKDVRDATNIFIRRYLTEGDVYKLIADDAVGWDIAALRLLCKNKPRSRQQESVDHQTKKHHQIPEGYEIITWYSNSGENFLTFDASTKILLRIEKNKHPLKQHPVHFLILEKDALQPFGKSQVELIFGRQEFQDLMLNGAMKLWYRNINPSIIGYGAVNSIPNLSPGKYTQISNPNAKIEPFEVNTQTLMQYSGISEANLGSMVNLVGSADQQMAASAGGGMSATPQGVDAQTAMVDITTNNYQKAIESFFSHYCSYALTIFFQEMKMVEKVKPTAEARNKLLEAGLEPEKIDKEGLLDIDFKLLATEYWVRCVPGSLVELEDEKQLRVLNALFIPLSQAMPALAAANDPNMLANAAKAMQYIISKEIELSGASNALDIKTIWDTGNLEAVDDKDQRINAIESTQSDMGLVVNEELETMSSAVLQLQGQVEMLMEANKILLEKIGVPKPQLESVPTSSEQPPSTELESQVA